MIANCVTFGLAGAIGFHRLPPVASARDSARKIHAMNNLFRLPKDQEMVNWTWDFRVLSRVKNSTRIDAPSAGNTVWTAQHVKVVGWLAARTLTSGVTRAATESS